MKNFLITFLSVLLLSPLVALEDKIAVTVDEQVITEQDIYGRYGLLKKMQNHESFPSYDQQVRHQILEHLIDEAVTHAYWKDHTNNSDLVNNFELERAMEQYDLSSLEKKALKDYLTAQKQRQILQKELFSKNLTFDAQEKEQYFEQNFAAFPIDLVATFQLGYSPCYGSAFQRAQSEAKTFESIPLSQWPDFFVKQKRWRNLGVWQHFEDEQECIALRIESLHSSFLLDHRYEISVFHIQGRSSVAKEELIEYDNSGLLPKDVLEINADSYSIIDRNELPPQIHQQSLAGDMIPLYEQENSCGYLFIRHRSPLNDQALEDLVYSYADQLLRQESVQQSFDLWVTQKRKMYLIEKKVRDY